MAQKFALISDIHGNFVALKAVLQKIRSLLGPDALIRCLGDIVGYGPNPCECLRAVQASCEFTLLGNHDMAVLFDPEDFNPSAENAVFWTRDLVELSDDSAVLIGYLGAAQSERRDGRLQYVHGSPRYPLDEYIFPVDVDERVKTLDAVFGVMEKANVNVCFNGHTHRPGVMELATVLVPTKYMFRTPEALGGSIVLATDESFLVNVGSVGQPRDGDPRACFVVVSIGDAGVVTVQWHRVDYDIKSVAESIYDIPELDNSLGDRLFDGR